MRGVEHLQAIVGGDGMQGAVGAFNMTKPNGRMRNAHWPVANRAIAATGHQRAVAIKGDIEDGLLMSEVEYGATILGRAADEISRWSIGPAAADWLATNQRDIVVIGIRILP